MPKHYDWSKEGMSRIEKRKEARDFAEQNLKACATSVLARKSQSTSLSAEYHQLVDMCADWSGLPHTTALEIADNIVIMAALRKAKDGEKE